MEIRIEPISAARGGDARRSFVAAWRAANTSVDAVFYDYTALTREERDELSRHVEAEGRIVVVHPQSSGAGIRLLWPIDFVTEQIEGTAPPVDTVVVAGVGSSAVGTAALARDAANHLGRPVAGVVSGMGLADIVSEALGGWFVFGARNALRDAFARVFDALEMNDHVRDPRTHEDVKASIEALGLAKDEFIYGSPDSTSLLYLLTTLGPRIRTLVGHSKGNYSIDNALRGWVTACARSQTPLPTDVCIVTLGAVIRLPEEFPNVHQFIGTIDGLGMLNSRPFIECEGVPYAWHTLNAKLVGHVTVANALRASKLPQGDAHPPARRRKAHSRTH